MILPLEIKKRLFTARVWSMLNRVNSKHRTLTYMHPRQIYELLRLAYKLHRLTFKLYRLTYELHRLIYEFRRQTNKHQTDL